MNVVWKRPDGLHDAVPTDYEVVKVGTHSNLWLHKREKDTFPFRVSGGWEEEAQTVKLNRLVNLLGHDEDAWLTHIESDFDHSMKDDRGVFFEDLSQWIASLGKVAKGGNWEVEIMSRTFDTISERLALVKDRFLK